MDAHDTSGTDSGWQQEGALTVGGGTPTLVSYSSPAAGTYVFTYADTGGYQSLDWVHSLFQNSLTGVGACWIAYSRTTNQLFLVNDTGTATSIGLTPGASGTVQNSQCSLNALASSAFGSGNTLTLSLAITFQTGFTGTKNVYMDAHDATGGDTGWQQKGTLTLGGGTPSVVSYSSPGAGMYVFTYSDTAGYQSLDRAQSLFNASLNGVGACWIQYSRATNQLFLVNDAGTAALGGLTPGAAGTVQNSQCGLNAGASSVSGSGNTLTLNLAINFYKGFVLGTKSIYMDAHDTSGADSGWQQKGSQTLP
jgi:hypothetical protein